MKGILDDKLLERFRSVLARVGVAPENARFERPEVHSEGGITLVEAPISCGYELQGEEWGVAEGVVVDLPATLRLTIDPSGRVEEFLCDLPDEEEKNSAASYVRGLAARGEIAPFTGSAPDTRGLMAQRKPYYITVDESGRKRLQRAFFSLTSR